MKDKNQQLEHIIYMDIWHVLLTWKREENGWKWKEKKTSENKRFDLLTEKYIFSSIS